MYGVVAPEVSAGSNHVGVSEMWRPQVTWPSFAKALWTIPMIRVARSAATVEIQRTCFMGFTPFRQPAPDGSSRRRYIDGPVDQSRSRGGAPDRPLWRAHRRHRLPDVHRRWW